MEAAQITFGTKYDITLNGLEEGDQDAGINLQIWVDNSNVETTGELKVSMCRGGTLTQVFTVTGLDEDGAVGEILNIGAEEEDGETHNWAQSVTFDLNYSEAGRSFLNVKSKFTNDSDTYRQHIVIDLLDEGVSNMRVSRTGTWEGNTFAQMGAAKHDGSYGQVLFANSFTGSEGGQDFTFDFTRRAYFDADGFIVASDATTAFAEDGNLYVADADVPKELDSTFDPGSFSADEWDCTTEESVTVDMTGTNGAAHDACDTNRGEWVNCHDEAAYQDSEEEHDIDETKQHEAEHFDDVEEGEEEASE